jgi:Mg2+ and Co2+ transporter CorA
MNKQRRKSLSEIIDLIEAIKPMVEALKGEAENIRDRISSDRDEEQEAYDNMPVSLQDGERGQDMSESIDRMEEAHTDIETLFDALDQIDLDDLISKIDEARGAE